MLSFRMHAAAARVPVCVSWYLSIRPLSRRAWQLLLPSSNLILASGLIKEHFKPHCKWPTSSHIKRETSTPHSYSKTIHHIQSSPSSAHLPLRFTLHLSI
jgi:hypothetical protein